MPFLGWHIGRKRIQKKKFSIAQNQDKTIAASNLEETTLSENKSDPEIENKSEPLQVAKPALPLKRNRDSVLLFPRGEESLLVLRKAEKQFDLLEGNESLNKKQFNASSMVPGTSSKTPSTQ